MSINLLAPELLSEIFLWLAALHARPGDCEWTIRYGWMAVMEVCKHWHDAALACPALWSHISIDSTFRDSHKAVDRLLRQSKSAPLSVDVGSSVRDTRFSARKTIAPLLKHMDRIQRLRIRMLGDISPDPLREIMGMTLPRLTELDISLKIYRTSHVLLDLSYWLTAASFPSLRHLSLHNCLISWDSTIFSILQTISFSHLDSRVAGASFRPPSPVLTIRGPTLDELISALNSGLRGFALRGLSPIPNDFDLKAKTPYRIDSLANLRTLSLTMDIRFCSAFIERVHLGSHCNWSISIVHADRSRRISDLALPHLSDDVIVQFCTLKVAATNERLYLSAMFTTDEETFPVQNDVELLTWEKVTPLDLSQTVIAATGWRCITAVELGSDGRSVCGSIKAWRAFLEGFTVLQRLVFHPGPRNMNAADMEALVGRLVGALAQPESRTRCPRYNGQESDHRDSHSVICPRLRELSFAGPSAPAFSFRRRGRTPDGDVFQNSTEMWKRLVDCLKVRADCGSRLRDISWEDELLDVPVDFLVSIQVSVDLVCIPGILPSNW